MSVQNVLKQRPVAHVKLQLRLFSNWVQKLCFSRSTSVETMMARGQLQDIELAPGLLGLELTEGAAKVHLKKDQGVFYNPVQCFNRDISIAVINEFLRERRNFIIQNKKTWDKRGSILEALAASGLRSIRYGLELDNDLVQEIVANDISRSAVESIRSNVALNGLSEKVRPNLGDAILYMHQCKAEGKFFDVIDLDPYGCAAKFLDSAVQAIQNDGLLCVTATDMSILCGNTPETCHAKYGSASLRGKFCHEMALRILLCSIESAANRHGKFITPLISISVDFYIRVFVKVQSSARIVKMSASKTALVFCCNGCENFHFQPMGVTIEDAGRMHFKNARGPPVGSNCVNCGSTFTMGGPIWINPIHNEEFVLKLHRSLRECSQLEVTDLPDFESLREHEKEKTEDVTSPVDGAVSNKITNDNTEGKDIKITCKSERISQRGTFQTLRRMQGIVNVISEELFDIPLHYTQEKLSQVLRTDTLPMMKLRSAIMNAGYRVSSSHTNRTSVKTNAPPQVIWDIMRHWIKSRNAAATNESKVRQVIMSHEIKTKVDFSERQDAVAPSMKDKSLRYQINPEKNWGPKARATATDEIDDKRKRLQGKKKRRRDAPMQNVVEPQNTTENGDEGSNVQDCGEGDHNLEQNCLVEGSNGKSASSSPVPDQAEGPCAKKERIDTSTVT